MTTVTAAPRKTFQRQVLDRLGLDICSGKYPPGSTLPSENELCEEFSYSRIVIREAIKSLAAKGMLEVRRKIGTSVLRADEWNLFDPDIIVWRNQVSGIDRKMARDFMELRRIIEPAAARLAARRATGEQRRAIRDSLNDMERAAGGKGDYPLADLAFHTAVLSSCNNQFLRQLRNSMSAVLYGSFQFLEKKRGDASVSLAVHRALCVAIEMGEPDTAEAAARRLIEQAVRDLKDLHGE